MPPWACSFPGIAVPSVSDLILLVLRLGSPGKVLKSIIGRISVQMARLHPLRPRPDERLQYKVVHEGPTNTAVTTNVDGFVTELSVPKGPQDSRSDITATPLTCGAAVTPHPTLVAYLVPVLRSDHRQPPLGHRTSRTRAYRSAYSTPC